MPLFFVLFLFFLFFENASRKSWGKAGECENRFFLAHYPRPPAHVWGKVWVRFGYLREDEVEIKGDKKGDKK